MSPRDVLIIEDVAETRAWLSDIVRRAWPEAVPRGAATLEEGRRAMRDGPDLALIDLNLPDGSGLTLLREAQEAKAGTALVVTTAMSDDATVVAALSAGAQGYLLKDYPEEVQVQQLRQLMLGVPALSPAIARRIMEHFGRTGPTAAADGAQLTAREREVLALIARGLRTAEVAGELGLAQTTVAGYIKTIYRKLGISSRAEAAWHAAQMGLRQA
jgi:DNA-binding NarL/FixJ family response regulator